MRVEGRLHYHNTWIILKVDNDFAKYYKWLIQRHTLLKIQLPKEGAHVTVLAGKYEKPKVDGLWKKHENAVVLFEYDPYLHFDGLYFWVTGHSAFLSKIRITMGLNPTPFHPFHITIGNLKNEQDKKDKG